MRFKDTTKAQYNHFEVSKWDLPHTPSVLQYGPETCQHQSPALNNSTQKAYTSTLHSMRLHNGAVQRSRCHTPPRGTDNTTAVPSWISAALFSNRVVVWGSSAGKESHIPGDGRKPAGRGGGLLGLRLRFPAGPRSHPRAPPLAGRPGRVLSSYYMTGVCVWCIALKLQSQAELDIQLLKYVKKSNTKSTTT